MSDFTVITEGLAFPEGPVWMPDGSLVIVELAAGTVSRISPQGVKQVIATPGGSPNGAALGPDGHLYICNSGGFTWERRDGLLWPTGTPDDYSGGRIERVNIDTGKVERLYDNCNGFPLSGPNDIVFDAHGGFYFSDHGKRRARHVECGGLYYAKADGSLIREVVYPLVTANGVGLSPDGREVYVAETDTGHIWAWKIMAPGVVAREGLLPGRHLAGPPGFTCWDSMALEDNGNLCIASLMNGGIAVVSPEGRSVDFIALPDPLTTNICFGGADMMDAYVTMSGMGQLVKMRWKRRGREPLHSQVHEPKSVR